MCYLAWIWPIQHYLLLSPYIGYGIFGLLMAWSLWYRRRRMAMRARTLSEEMGASKPG